MTDLLTRTLPGAPAPAPAALPAEADAPASVFSDTTAHDLAVVVAPSTGRFRPALDAGTPVEAGALLGNVCGGGGRADAVRTPVRGAVADLLVRPGQLVYRGQALAWLRRGTQQEAA